MEEFLFNPAALRDIFQPQPISNTDNHELDVKNKEHIIENSDESSSNDGEIVAQQIVILTQTVELYRKTIESQKLKIDKYKAKYISEKDKYEQLKNYFIEAGKIHKELIQKHNYLQQSFSKLESENIALNLLIAQMSEQMEAKTESSSIFTQTTINEELVENSSNSNHGKITHKHSNFPEDSTETITIVKEVIDGIVDIIDLEFSTNNNE